MRFDGKSYRSISSARLVSDETKTRKSSPRPAERPSGGRRTAEKPRFSVQPHIEIALTYLNVLVRQPYWHTGLYGARFLLASL